MSYTSGNPERDAMLKRSLGEILACHEQPTLESVAATLPADFDLEQSEIDGMLETVKPQPVVIPHGPRGQKPMFTTTPAGDSLPEPTPVLSHAEPATIVIDDGADIEHVKHSITEMGSRRQLDAANARHNAARERMADAQATLRHTRGDLASAVMGWQLLAENSTDGLSPEQRRQREVRWHIEAQNAERQARSSRRSATAFVQKRMQNGPGRGAYSRTAAARAGFANYDPSRGPVAKVPTES